MTKVIHHRHPNAAHPACDGTGQTRRFRSTDKWEMVTCKRCLKISHAMAVAVADAIDSLARASRE